MLKFFARAFLAGFVFSLSLRKTGCSTCQGIDICNWLEWNSWTPCNKTCGTNEIKERARSLCCPPDIDRETCIVNCSKNESDFNETKDCGAFCYNDGSYNDTCRCKERFYGDCCEKRKYSGLLQLFIYTFYNSYRVNIENHLARH